MLNKQQTNKTGKVQKATEVIS